MALNLAKALFDGPPANTMAGTLHTQAQLPYAALQ